MNGSGVPTETVGSLGRCLVPGHSVPGLHFGVKVYSFDSESDRDSVSLLDLGPSVPLGPQKDRLGVCMALRASRVLRLPGLLRKERDFLCLSEYTGTRSRTPCLCPSPHLPSGSQRSLIFPLVDFARVRYVEDSGSKHGSPPEVLTPLPPFSLSPLPTPDSTTLAVLTSTLGPDTRLSRVLSSSFSSYFCPVDYRPVGTRILLVETRLSSLP